MRSLNNNYGEIHSLLTEEECYTIGTNDGKELIHHFTLSQ